MIVLTGASGFLGKIVYQHLVPNFKVKGLCLASQPWPELITIDLTDAAALSNLLNLYKPSIVIHSAAWRDPERCERDPHGATKIHVNVTKSLADWCNQNDAKLIYISTDYVFDGLNPPYLEDAPYSPVSVYGQTKAHGETAAAICKKHIIARIPLQYGFSILPDDSFLLKTLSNLATAQKMEIDDFQLRYPTLSDDVAKALIDLIKIDFNGKIHLCSPSGDTRFGIIKMIAKVFEMDDSNLVAAPNPVNQLANRPKDSRVSTALYDSLNLHRFSSLENGLLFTRDLMLKYNYDWKKIIS